jgi:hypothetical protein
MTLSPLVLIAIGLPMLVLGVVLVVRFFRHNRLHRRPAEPPPQDARGPVWSQNALLGALLVSLGTLLSVFGLAALVAGPDA